MFNNIISFVLSFILNLDISHSLYVVNKNLLLSNNIQALIHCSFINLFLLHYYTTGTLLLWNLTRIYSMGFLLADILYFYVYHKTSNWKIYLVHHSIFFISWIFISNMDSTIYRLFTRMLLAELSGMTLNIRHLAKKYKYENLDLSMSLLTYILFFIFRILNFTEMIGITYKLKLYQFVVILIPLTVMQYYWFYLMSIKLWYFVYPSIDDKRKNK